MENLENIKEDVKNHTSMVLSEEMIKELLETTKWARFLAIMGYVGMGLLLLLALIMIVIGLLGLSRGINLSAFGGAYLVLVVVYYFPVTYTNKFALLTKSGLLSNNAAEVAEGFKNIRKLYKFSVIMVIVIIVLYILAMIGALLVQFLIH